jgi:hypothetical protein
VKLTWSKQPNERGLARVVQGPRGAILKADGERVASVSPKPIGFHKYRGWYWVARDDASRIPLRNSCGEPAATLDEAKVQAESYVRECLGLPKKKPRRQ